MGDDSNWEALGYTLVSTIDTGLLQGNWGGAIEILGNSENYLGSTWEWVNNPGWDIVIGLPDEEEWGEEWVDEVEDEVADVEAEAAARKAALIAEARANYETWRAE